MTMDTRAIIRVALGTGVLLLVPLIAMLFTDEVDWELSDFVAAGALLIIASLAYRLVAPRVPSLSYRVGVGVAIGAALLVVWTILAVGLP